VFRRRALAPRAAAREIFTRAQDRIGRAWWEPEMPSFDLAPIRAAIKAKIAAVANVGQVHDRERYAKTASDAAQRCTRATRRPATASSAGS
jgi:PHP family Zn ribbon phosphoesterase